jgi:hypothetical protein
MNRKSWLVLVGCFVAGVALPAGCECSSSETIDTGGSGATGGTSHTGGTGGSLGGFDPGADAGGYTPQCQNLECQQVPCDGGVTTTLSGTIYDPSGTLPLYDVGVYVPNAPLDPVPEGLICDKCDATFSGAPLVSALTDTQGKFTIENVPVGADIPLVIQIGKWRREITIPTVSACVDNPLTDPQVTRLPKSMAEGNLPRIALTTGMADPLFCLLRRLGIDDSEYGIDGSAARIHFYRGVNGSTGYDNGFGSSPGATFPDAQTTLWSTEWSQYDIVMLSCEGDEYPDAKTGHRVALRDYINLGGRVFATHYHYNWFQGDAPADLASVATFTSTQNNFNGLVDIDQTFPKGLALAQWMDFVDGSSPFGQFNVLEGRQHTQSVDTNLARIWVRYLGNTEYFSFNAPIGAPEDDQCGRMVFSDIHVSAGAGDADGDFPGACNNGPLTEQEKALIFMFFDLSACLIPDDHPQCPPGEAYCGGASDPPCAGTCVNGCCQAVPT